MEVPSDQYHRDIDMHCYVRDGNIEEKSDVLTVMEFSIAADGTEEVSFPVPAGTQTVYKGELITIDDGMFSFSSDLPGEFRFAFISPVTHRDFEVTIHAL